MNKPRRKRIDAILQKLEELSEELCIIKEEEEEAFENLPESLQETERGESMQDAINNMDEAISNISDATEYLRDACS